MAFFDIFNYIQYKAEIHNIAFAQFSLWAMHRIPTIHVNTMRFEFSQVVTLAAAKI